MIGSGKAVKSMLLVSPTGQMYEHICELLPNDEFDPIVNVSSAGEARRLLSSTDFDLLVVNAPLTDEFGVDFVQNYVETPIGILFLCKSDIYDQVSARLEDFGVLTLPKPINRQILFTAIKLAAAVHARLGLFEEKNRTLREKMADIRVVDRAKWLLIGNLNMTENDAHYYIEKQAMNSRLSRREVAEHIIRTYDK